MNIILKNYSWLLIATILLYATTAQAQVKWVNVNASYAPLPQGFNVYKTTDSLDGKPFLAYYAIADLKSKHLNFTTDTTYKRRLTPKQFFEKNGHSLLVVNTTFFSFATNQNLGVVIKNGKLVAYNIHSTPGKGKDTLTYRHPFTGAIGISKKHTADVAWTFTDSTKKFAYATQQPAEAVKDAVPNENLKGILQNITTTPPTFKKWKMQTAVGGGPVLVQNGAIKVTNNEELKFTGKAISDQHPRTLIGYTKDNHLIIMVIEGRNPGISDGATLTQEAQLMINLGCTEALNLDGGGSSCMLINGKETIYGSDKIERSVPAVFIISGE